MTDKLITLARIRFFRCFLDYQQKTCGLTDLLLFCSNADCVQLVFVRLHYLLEDVLGRVDVVNLSGHREDCLLGSERGLGHDNCGVRIGGDLLDHLARHADGELEHGTRQFELGGLD